MSCITLKEIYFRVLIEADDERFYHQDYENGVHKLIIHKVKSLHFKLSIHIHINHYR